MNVRAVLARAAGHLAERGVDSPAVDAEWLLAHVLGVSRAALGLESELAPADEQRFCELVERRGKREPLAYVLGEWGFRRLTLKLDARALVPRPETEIVVERCLALLDGRRDPHVLDVGTGSGAIALAIADEHPTARVTALEHSSDALALARENAAATALSDRVRFIAGDLTDELEGAPYELIVSNPPYVLPDELAELAPEVTEWEPREALVDRGQTERVARAAQDALRSGGKLVLETHPAGASRLAGLLRELGFADVRVTRDLAGRERVVEGRWA